MIDLYFWPTPNGYKPLLLLEEAGIPYRLTTVDITVREQFRSEFLLISPNNKIPAITDSDVLVEGRPLRLFESGAILLHLAEKTGRFIPTATAQRAEVMQWLFWQVGGVGPMFGQNLHFTRYASQIVPYGIERYVTETRRLLQVLDWRLQEREFVAGDYSIADMAVYPWVVTHEALSIHLDDYRHVQRWFEQIAARPAVKHAYATGSQFHPAETIAAAVTNTARNVPQRRLESGAAAH